MKKISQQRFEEHVYDLYDEIEVVGIYEGTRSKITMYCKIRDDNNLDHGEYTTTAESLLYQGRGCQKCANNIRSKAQIKFSHNKDFFTVANLINSYWAGFIAADGCIVSNRLLTILLKQSDEGHLVRFCQDIQYDGTIYHGSSVIREKRYYRSEIQISNAEKIIYDLKENFGIDRKKSFTYTRPNITGDLALSFIKGYIDGDGHIDVVKRKRLHVCGTQETLSWIKEIFDEIAPAQSANGLVAEVRQQGNISVYEIGGNRVLKILKMMSDLPVSGLERKWNQVLALPRCKL